MKNETPILFSDPDPLVDYVIEKVGKTIVLGMCLGLGKPNHFANAIYKRALEDPSLNLKILTALSLEPPTWSSDLEKRFLEPLVQRVWKGYVNLDYITAVRKKELPPNVEVSEFFYKAGGFLDNEHMQQNYTSTNYTHAARDVRDNGMNVGGQLVAKKVINGQPMFSMSSNSDTALDAFRTLQKQKADNRRSGRLPLGF
jgi:acyl-CoA hydrolase